MSTMDMKQSSHPSHSIPSATEHYQGTQLAGDLLPKAANDNKSASQRSLETQHLDQLISEFHNIMSGGGKVIPGPGAKNE